MIGGHGMIYAMLYVIVGPIYRFVRYEMKTKRLVLVRYLIPTIFIDT